MKEHIRKSYAHTIYASYLGYITQAVVNNFAPLLFLTFVSDYGLNYWSGGSAGFIWQCLCGTDDSSCFVCCRRWDY